MRKTQTMGDRLDQWLGDALVAAMLLLGFVFFIAAARAEGPAMDPDFRPLQSRPVSAG